jgi:hypothetical protein
MPRTSLTVQTVSRTTPITDPTQNIPDAVNGNSFDNSSGRVMLYVTNSNASSRTLTVTAVGTFDGVANPNKTYTLATNTRTAIGFFKKSYYNQDDDLVYLDWSASADVTVEVLKMPNYGD